MGQHELALLVLHFPYRGKPIINAGSSEAELLCTKQRKGETQLTAVLYSNFTCFSNLTHKY